jgi:hypothetical protein
VGYGWDFRSRSRLGWDSDMAEGQGIAGDITFHDSDRYVARVGTWHDEDRDVKAWQDNDEDQDTRNQR